MVEAHCLSREHRTLQLPSWPDHLNGFRIGLISDLHLRLENNTDRLDRTIDFLIGQDPDIVVITGDLLECWQPGIADAMASQLAPLAVLGSRVLVIPGNHDYFFGDAAELRPGLEAHGFTYLINQCVISQGVNWVGIDSAIGGKPDLFEPIRECDLDCPIVVLWHEPDVVEFVPSGVELMLAGHSHGGQFTAPWGWAPMTSDLGSRYLRGYYPEAPIPLYVSRGVGTTGFPSRLFCPPEVTILTLIGPGG